MHMNREDMSSSNIHTLKFEPRRHGEQQAVSLAAWHTCTPLTQSGELQGPEGMAVAETWSKLVAVIVEAAAEAAVVMVT